MEHLPEVGQFQPPCQVMEKRRVEFVVAEK
jgi:hypothetical protein